MPHRWKSHDSDDRPLPALCILYSPFAPWEKNTLADAGYVFNRRCGVETAEAPQSVKTNAAITAVAMQRQFGRVDQFSGSFGAMWSSVNASFIPMAHFSRITL